MPDPVLVDHLVATTALTPAEAARVVEDVIAFHAEPVEDYVRRRHAQPQDLRRQERRDLRAASPRSSPPAVVAAPELTERQLRRIIYG